MKVKNIVLLCVTTNFIVGCTAVKPPVYNWEWINQDGENYQYSNSKPRTFDYGYVEPTLKFVMHSGKNQPLYDSLKKIAPDDWLIQLSPDVSKKFRTLISWDGNDEWVYVVKKVAVRYGLDANFNSDKKILAISYKQKAQRSEMATLPVAGSVKPATAVLPVAGSVKPATAVLPVAGSVKPATAVLPVAGSVKPATAVLPVAGSVKPATAVLPVAGSVKPATAVLPVAGSVKPATAILPVAGSVKPATAVLPVAGSVKPATAVLPVAGSVKPATAVLPVAGSVKPATAVLPVAGSVKPDRMKPVKIWRIYKGMTLRDGIMSWAASEHCNLPSASNWIVIWDTPINYSIDAPLHFSGDFKAALSSVLSLYQRAETPLYAITNTPQCLIRIIDKRG